MKLAVLTPLPPLRSGIAHYSAMLLPELARRHEVTVVVDQAEVELAGFQVIRVAELDSSAFDGVVCQMGNNPHHEFMWNWARRNPSVVVLHEIVLHHLLVECTLARGDAAGLVDALRAEYGDAGAAIAEARAAGLHGEIANFLMPASGRFAEKAKHVIVHNQWAATRLREEGVTTPITVIQHPYASPPRVSAEQVERARTTVGWAAGERIIGTFGFVPSAKRPEVVMEAFAQALSRDGALRLLFVGEPAPNIALHDLAARFGVPDGKWATTGYVTDREFDVWLHAVDRVVSLRYPTAGESSGPIARAFAVGRPVAVSDYAQFAEYPSSLVVGIPFEGETDALARFIADDSIDGARIGAAQREWLAANATVVHAADGYDRALASAARREPAKAAPEGVPLHPALEASIVETRSVGGRASVRVRLTNRGDSMLFGRTWGQPHYLLHTTIVAGGVAAEHGARALPRDLAPGESTELEIDGAHIDRIELRHSLSGVPDAGRDPFAVLEPVR
jgi:glycosyltransferase involved in cell wall biosynthesis